MGGDSWISRQQLASGWVIFMDRYFLASMEGERAQASIDGEELSEAETARRVVAVVSAQLRISADSGIPHQAQNATLALAGLIAADGGIRTLPVVDELLAWATGPSEDGEWR